MSKCSERSSPVASLVAAAGLSADAQAIGLVQITATGDLEMGGHLVSGATIVESSGGTTYDWTDHRHRRRHADQQVDRDQSGL